MPFVAPFHRIQSITGGRGGGRGGAGGEGVSDILI